MSLKIKTAAILFLILGLFSLLNIAIQQRIIYPSFVSLEEYEAITNINRVTEAIENELNHLELFCRDYSLWDDTYSFIKFQDEEYIKSNLGLNTFVDNGIAHISYHTNDSTIIFSKTLNPTYAYEQNIDELDQLIPELINRITTHKAPLPERGFSGILNTTYMPILISVQPVMNSDRDSDSPGIMVMGRYLSNNLINRITNQIEVKFNISMAHHEMSTIKDLTPRIISETNVTYVVQSSFSTLVSHEFLEFSTLYPRVITMEGKRSIVTAEIIMIVTMIVLMAVIHRFISRVIINPIRSVAKSARMIREENDYTLMIKRKSDDEIGSMIEEFNKMIVKIHHQTEELNSLARIDGLTGLYNRRTLNEILQVEWGRMRRTKETLTLLLLDVDHFKKYNDNYGHFNGDEALRKIATVLKNVTQRPADTATRYGGEEFCIVLPQTSTDGGAVIAEKICSSVRELSISHTASHPLPIVTVSIGIASAVPTENISAADLIKRADKALYLAKEEGRNRWICIDHITQLNEITMK